jgi:hypothetical protein
LHAARLRQIAEECVLRTTGGQGRLRGAAMVDALEYKLIKDKVEP